MEVRFRLVDVFTEAPFAGNQLCVVPDPPADLDAATMQILAREISFSETAFVTEAGGGRYTVRIFTPVEELHFAGHPTLGTAATLVDEGRIDAVAVQTSLAGDVPVEVDAAAGVAWMRQLPVVFGPELTDRGAIAAAAGLTTQDLVPGLPSVPASTGLTHLMVPIRDEPAMRRAARNPRGCLDVAERTETESLYLFTVRGDGDVMARMFDKGDTIGEDPATGSAAGPLGGYLAAHGLAGMPGGRAVVAQGEMVNRPSFLHLDVSPEGDGWAIRVGGGVRFVGDGRFVL
jgi:trans-2,3-dihydro-3-hydroxyanthranilate isomerase